MKTVTLAGFQHFNLGDTYEGRTIVRIEEVFADGKCAVTLTLGEA